MTIYLTFLATLFGGVVLLVMLITAAVTVYRYAFERGSSAAKAEFAASRPRARHERLYAPLGALFITRHVTTSCAVLAPYLKQRIRNAVKALWNWKLLTALRALGDKQQTKELAEIEYGGRFPMTQISSILRGNEAFADRKLLDLVRRADRSRYESEDDDGLTDEELALFYHIVETEAELNKLLNSTDT